MDDIVIPPAELGLRERILVAFRGVTGDGNRIPATQFQTIIKSFGLSFGNPAVDRIMLQCRIDEEGYVDFSAFGDDVLRRRAINQYVEGAHESSAKTASISTLADFGSPSASGSKANNSYEFRTALETMTGTTLPSVLPAELMRLPQQERVRRLAREIHALFTQFDTARISLDMFRARLRGYGIIETPEVSRLLQQTPLNFAKFYKALQHDELVGVESPLPAVSIYRPATAAGRGTGTPTGVSGGQSQAGSPDLYAAGRYSARPQERQYNPLTGEGKYVAPGELDRHAMVSPYNTAVFSNVDASIARGKAREDPRHMAETGAGNIIFNKGDNKEGVEYALGMEQFNERRTKMGRGPESAAAMIHDADSRFESSTQAAQRTGLYGKEDVSHRPVTSAGYRTADRGLLREQVYSAVRQLDAGRISAKTFRERLANLGIDIPIAAEKLLQVYDSNGKADFSRFIRAFEDFFAAHSGANLPASSGASDHDVDAESYGGGISRDQMFLRDDRAELVSPVRPSSRYVASGDLTNFTAGSTSGGSFYSPHMNPLLKGHGDILSWSTPPTAGEADTGRSGKKLPDRKLYDTYSPALDLVSVGDREKLSRAPLGLDGLGLDSRELYDLTSRRHVSEARFKDSGNITTWMGAAPGTFSSEDASKDLNSVLGKGRARVTTLRSGEQISQSPIS